ncbi:hypothetical protein IWZ00DRAFT_132668 [Phyllosticta capitalensis]
MGVPSFEASNAIIYLTYGALLLSGCAVAWKLRHQNKGEYLSSNRTQKGQSQVKKCSTLFPLRSTSSRRVS